MTNELLPCPFCGSYDLGVTTFSNYRDQWFEDAIICNKCDGSCPKDKWNTRASGWVSVKDRLPFDSFEKLIFFNYAGVELTSIGTYENDKWVDIVGVEVIITHWMPLPTPPQEPE